MNPTHPSPGQGTQVHEAYGQASGRRVRRVVCDAFFPSPAVPGTPVPLSEVGMEKLPKLPDALDDPSLSHVHKDVTLNRAASEGVMCGVMPVWMS